MILLLILPLVAPEKIDLNYAVEYIERFGYVNKSEHDIADMASILKDFQEKFNLPVDGTLNSATIQLLERPRCTVGENDHSEHSYRVKTKWQKTNLTWYFPQATPPYVAAAEKAFNIWQQNSKFTFKRVTIPMPSPDITITIVPKRHQFRANCQGNQYCAFNFDGPGKVLAHAYFPSGDGCIEIHLDNNERWNPNLDGIVQDTESSFLLVLAHEIGHTLGIGHSDVSTAIMYPWYQKNMSMLDEDDKMALEYLYGPTQKFVHNPYNKATTLPPPPPPHSTQQPTLQPMTQICDIKSPDFMFLASTPYFPKFRIYVGYNRFLWKFDLHDIHIPLHSEYIKDYLPQNILHESISHSFQNSAGNLFAFNKNTGDYYTAPFPDLTILEINKVPVPTNSKVDVIFQTNSGQIFVFYDKTTQYIEFNDGFKKILYRGRVSDRFLGLPKNPTSAFRYIDGYIYFFTQDNTYYKFSEYSRSVVSSGPFDWNLFDIPCPNTSLKEQLKALLTRVLSIYE